MYKIVIGFKVMKAYARKILGKFVNYLLAASDIDSRIISGVTKSNQILLKDFLQNIENQLNLNSLKSTTNYVEQNLASTKSFSTCFEIYDYVLTEIGNIDGLFCEFGVYKGRTINYIASKIDTQIHGFDSFEGLPEFWRSGFDKGAFQVNKSEIATFNPNVYLHVGLFEDTLKNFLDEYKQPVAFIHIDCDLYSSTTTILSYLRNRIREGTIIIFDEYFNYPCWQQHEFKAFQEFVKLNQITYEYLCYNKQHEQVAIRITHCPFFNDDSAYKTTNNIYVLSK